jgi:hypothetical protein
MAEGTLMTDMSPFDHRQDAELGRALQRALAVPDDAAFVRRVIAAADQVYGDVAPGQWWSVLTAWARPGLVAAMLMVAAAAFWLGLWVGTRGAGSNMASFSDPLQTESEHLTVPALLVEDRAPTVDVVLAVAMGR